MLMGFSRFMEEGIRESYELLILGSILFIPGSYHTFISFMAFRMVDGYTFDQVAVFDDGFDANAD